MLNIVTNLQVLQEFKRCKFFKQNLGLVATVEKNGNRTYNKDDQFSYNYNTQYNTTIYGQGNIGNIKFYVDHYIQGITFAVYSVDFQEFIYQLDRSIIKEKGIDFYIGHILKVTEKEYDQRAINNELKKSVEKEKGSSEKVFKNPGNVNYEDLKAYLEEKNSKRYL